MSENTTSNELWWRLWFFSIDLRKSVSDPIIHEYTVALRHKLDATKFLFALLGSTTKKALIAFKEESENENIALDDTMKYDFQSLVYFEAFLYFVSSMFDVLACITYYLYKTETNSIPQSSFKSQMNYFMKEEPSRDSEYAELLRNHATWIDNIFENRNAFAHFYTPFLGFDGDTLVFEHRKPKQGNPDRDGQFQSVTTYMMDTMKNIDEFLSEYIRIQRKRVPETEKTKMLKNVLQNQSKVPIATMSPSWNKCCVRRFA